MYEARFQLTQRPFGAAPQAVHYYPTPSMESARHVIMRGIETNAGPGTIIGGAGTGKTTLCLKLEQHYRDIMPTAFLSCCGIQSRRELWQNVLFTFDQPYDGDEGELRIALTNYVRSSERQELLLIIDDVDDLPVELMEELRALSNMTHNGVWCANMVLAGKTKFEERLGRPSMESLEQRISSRNYLSSWNAEETANYIRFQIERCGGDVHALFSTGAFEEIYVATNGLPRLVNQLCDQALFLAALGDVDQLEAEHVAEAWADLQQLPPPNRQATPTEPLEIEFGTLEQPSSDDDAGEEENRGKLRPEEPSIVVRDPWIEDPSAAAEPDKSSVDEAAVEFGEMPPTETAAIGEAPPEAGGRPSFDFVDIDGTPSKSELPVEPPAAAAVGPPAADYRDLADSANLNLVDRLDDIEREVQRVSTELDGEQNHDGAATHDGGPWNPFMELFDEEELVFSTHNTLNNELVRRQAAVFTTGGESLIQVMRLVDQSATNNNPWEHLDDISSPVPADTGLALELAPHQHRLPEICDANQECIEFGEAEFRFNYAAPICRTQFEPEPEPEPEPGPEPTALSVSELDQQAAFQLNHEDDETNEDPNTVIICSAEQSHPIKGSSEKDCTGLQATSAWETHSFGHNSPPSWETECEPDEIVALVQVPTEGEPQTEIDGESHLAEVLEPNSPAAMVNPGHSAAIPPLTPGRAVETDQPENRNSLDGSKRRRFSQLFANLKPSDS